MPIDPKMSKTVKVAAVQMDANPASTIERLERAERLVISAVQSGAQLVVLPECFNTGYTYSEENHKRVEKINGLTANWMRDTATRLDVHLSGSLMLLDDSDVYNSLLLYAPDGRLWRYDKNYPWGWERGYFRESRLNPRVTVARTDLGDIGMLVCWDIGHTSLWKLYAGQVDLIVISSCPVDVGKATYYFPNGDYFTIEDMGSRIAAAADTVQLTFGTMLDQQTAWMRIPTVQAAQFGQIWTDIPKGRQAFLGYALIAPWLFKYLSQADRAKMQCNLVQECKIVNGNGEVIARLSKEDGEAFTQAEIGLPSNKPSPQQTQPEPPFPSLSYFIADTFLPGIMRSVYSKGKQHWKNL